MSGAPLPPAAQRQQGLPPHARVLSAWTTPALLLAVPATLIAEGLDGLWVALLFVVAPLFAFLAPASGRPGSRREGEQALVVVAILVLVGLLIWANLSLAGDVATWRGWPRWMGVFPAAGAALGFVLWPSAARHWGFLVPAGLIALYVPVAAVILGSHANPIATWSQVASEPAFRFSADSPWVTEGRALESRRGSLRLLFEEEHRVTPVDPGPLRIEVSDRGRLQVQEWTLAPGQSVTLRPGDRLQVYSAVRFRFQTDKRVPGAPVSGIAWADSSRSPRPLALLRFLGLGVTFLGGALAVVRFTAPTGPTRAEVGSDGVVLLGMLGWAECWAIYAVRWAPEVFLTGAPAITFLELPARVLGANPLGAWLVGLSLVGLFALFVAASVALRKLAVGEGETAVALGSDRGLWGGILTVAVLAALWPVDPWFLALSALGLGASTLGPLALSGPPPARSASGAWAVGVGLGVFLGLTAAGRLGIPAGPVVQAFIAYPALAGAPAAAGVLRVARRAARP